MREFSFLLVFRCVEDRDRLVVSEELVCRDEVGIPVKGVITIDISPAIARRFPDDAHAQYLRVIPSPICLHDDRPRWQIVKICFGEISTTVMGRGVCEIQRDEISRMAR